MNLQPNQRISLYIGGKEHRATVERIDYGFYWVCFDDDPVEMKWYTIDEMRRMMKSE